MSDEPIYLLTRVYAFYYVDDTRFTMANTTRNAPPGYTLNKAESYIQDDAAIAYWGLVDHPQLIFDVTDADSLFDEALAELKRRIDAITA